MRRAAPSRRAHRARGSRVRRLRAPLGASRDRGLLGAVVRPLPRDGAAVRKSCTGAQGARAPSEGEYRGGARSCRAHEHPRHSNDRSFPQRCRDEACLRRARCGQPGTVGAVVTRFLLVLPLLAAISAAAQTPHTHQHRFSDAEKWAHVFDDPERDAWQKPHQVIQALALKPDAAVADIGAGTGYFAARLANMLPRGTVYAVDVEPDMVRYLGERAKREGLANLRPIAARPDDARLPAKVDLVLMVDVYHHVEDRISYFRKLADSLAPGARIAVIDFRLDARRGPPAAARVAPERVKAELAQAGYALAAEHTFLPEQYFLVFARAR